MKKSKVTEEKNDLHKENTLLVFPFMYKATLSISKINAGLGGVPPSAQLGAMMQLQMMHNPQLMQNPQMQQMAASMLNFPQPNFMVILRTVLTAV